MASVVTRRPDDLVHLSDVPNDLRQRAGGIYEGSSESDVLRALRDGRLTAWDGDAPLPQDFWNGKEGRDLIMVGYLVSRAEVLAIWPDIAAGNVMLTVRMFADCSEPSLINCWRVLRGRCVFQHLRMALAARRPGLARKLALHDRGYHADQSQPDEHTGRRRHD